MKKAPAAEAAGAFFISQLNGHSYLGINAEACRGFLTCGMPELFCLFN